MPVPIRFLRLLIPALLAALILLVFGFFLARTSMAHLEAGSSTFLPHVTSNNAVEPYAVFLPQVMKISAPDVITIENSWTNDETPTPQIAFQPGDTILHKITGSNSAPGPITATISINETGPCGGGQVFSTTLQLSNGNWEHSAALNAPHCTGVFTATTTISSTNDFEQVSTKFVINDVITPTYTNFQGFDRCLNPTVEQMQAWWTYSPYYVFNIYLGGIHYPSWCQDPPIDAFWVHEVAKQGWKFTATWVGPQAPCTSFAHRIDQNETIAYAQGKSEAIAASDAARALGLFGELTLHYDVEGYSYSSSYTPSCRDAVQSFMQGWTDQLHELGLKAGGYGGACSSFISDWANNNPAPDQVWLAHWLLPAEYNSDANVLSSCINDNLWSNQQRLRQYAGDHAETHGGVTLGIDSNVFDTTAIELRNNQELQSSSQGFIKDYAPINPAGGWVLKEHQVYWTTNLGQTWDKRSPDNFYVLSAIFGTDQTGWIIGWEAGDLNLQIARSSDSGQTWSYSYLDDAHPLNLYPVVDAYFSVFDSNLLWVSLKIQSGSAFSHGLLYSSEDSGATWKHRQIPVGEPIHLLSATTGWTARDIPGSPAYLTFDGGATWQPGQLPQVSGNSETNIDLPSIPENTISIRTHGRQVIWAETLHNPCPGIKIAPGCELEQRVFVSDDGGLSWQEIDLPTNASNP